MSKVPVVEIFGPTLQGEGALAGVRTMFIRTGFCDGAGNQGWCEWCDSMFAVDPVNKPAWTMMTDENIIERLETLSAERAKSKNVTISGGNPVLHNLDGLVWRLRRIGYYIHLETQGTFFRPWVRKCDTVTVSPKPPSAGSNLNHDKLQHFLAQCIDSRTVIKVVVDVDDPRDYPFARKIMQQYGRFVRGRYLSIVTDPADTPDDLLRKWRVLTDLVLEDTVIPDVAVLPQLHVMLFGHGRGV